MHHRELLLSALKYPKAGTDLLKDDADLGALVIWLENTKVGLSLCSVQTVRALHAMIPALPSYPALTADT